MKNSQFPIARASGLVVQEMPDEVLVYDMNSNKAHCLNKTAAFVWRSCNGARTVSDITDLFESETKTNISEDLVWLAIDQLSENNLLEQQLKANFAGQSRREVIKKIGLASVIAIPVIASLVAPPSALANTSCKCTAGPLECGGPLGNQPGCGVNCNVPAGLCQ